VANENPVIGVTPDSIHFDLFTNGVDSVIFTITNTGNGPLDIYSIEDEEVSDEDWTPSYTQTVHHTPFYEKGVLEPSFGNQTEGSGGPDPFGYKWIDSDEPSGPVYSFTDISGTGTIANLQPTGSFDPKDEGMATITLPWDVNFYGNSYNQFQVNTNGFITFDMNFFASAFSNDQIPDPADPNLLVCPFWDDLDGSAGGDIYYEAIGNKFIVQWHNWGHFPSGTENMIFQVVFFKNSSTILFVYEHIVDEGSSTFGIENVDGTIGLPIAYNQTYAHDQLLVKISKGAEWLTEEPTSGTVAPGGSLDIKVKADATGMLGGDYLANVIIASNDPLNSVLKLPKVSLTVTGIPDINTTPDSLMFDSTFVGLTPSLDLTVENIGSDQLVVSSVTSTIPEFKFDTTSFNIAPFSSQNVVVTFEPLTPGIYEGWIVVASNDPDTPLDSTYVYGEAVEGPVAVITPMFTNPIPVPNNDSVDVYRWMYM